MTAETIIREVQALGGDITVDRGALRLRGDTSRLTDDLRDAVRSEAVGIAITLTRRLRPYSGLYRYVRRGDRVLTPDGEAEVVQVFADRITTIADGDTATRFYSPENVQLVRGQLQ